METQDETPKLFRNIPKVELHAHLNGSLSQCTLQKLIELKSKKSENIISQDLKNLSVASSDMSECFKVFNLIHHLTDNPEAIYMATYDVIQDFFKDGIHYLELRTTPKDNGRDMTQDIYVETVVKAIEDACSQLHKKMSVKLLLSVDRSRCLRSAEETVKCAEKHFMSSATVVGIDLSGNPRSGSIVSFMPVLEHAKKTGLKLAVHISEVPHAYEEEEQLIKLQPHRLGHGTFLHPDKGGSAKNFSLLNEYEIPLEICLSSNVICKTVPTYEEHHFPLFMKIGYPCILCTDDKGVFNTTLSKEYHLASKYYSLSTLELFDLSYKSIEYAFATDSEKNDLRKVWHQSKKKLSFL